MPTNKPSIASMINETDAIDAIADIPENRVLLAEKLTAAPSLKPQIVKGLTTVEQVFEHFNPKVEVEFESEEGAMRKETFGFKNLGDFGVQGITAQSNLLNDLTMKREQYQKIIRQLKSNNLLKQALVDKSKKQHLINALNALIKDLSEAR